MVKTEEELKKEREEAQQQLEAILKTTRPKNLQEGVTSGVSNIVGGAIGAAGIAVLAPTVGLAQGLRAGGLLGGVVGVTGGAVVGVVGAAGLAIAGALSGVAQVARGVAAVPQQIIAPRKGKWWNESEGKWVLTNMEEEKKNLPEGDNDILGKLEEEIDASIELGPSPTGQVADTFYYECLEIPSNADQAIIKRKYYLLARQYHPDKNPGDHEAAEKFKNIAEAYQVLSDPQLRAKYDKDGRDGLSPDKTSTVDGNVPKIDPALLFAFLFGSDQFQDYVGRLSTATSAQVGDSPKISRADAEKLQKRRVTRLAVKLIDKIAPWIEAEEGTRDTCEAYWSAEAVELSKASFGFQMVTTIGKIYAMLATVYQGSLDSGQGLPSLSKWAAKTRATMDQRNASSKNQIDAMKAGLDMMKLQAETQQKMAKAASDEEKAELQRNLETASVNVMVRVLWTTAVVDITSTLQETTQMVFFDQSVDKEVRKKRSAAVKRLGEIWMETPEPENAAEADTKRLYEEAAFAAMLETVKRRDEAAHGN